MAGGKSKSRNPVLLQHGMTIGSVAAETDDDFLFDCFVHYAPLHICKDPNAPGMILGGRTGAGKTAILRYIARTEEHVHEIDPSEMAMSYVSNSDILTFIHNIGGDLDLFFQTLWKHVLCIEYIRLRWSVKDEAGSLTVFDRLKSLFERDARKRKSLNYLQEWQGKFWITMDENIKELTEKVERRLQGELGGELHKAKIRGQYDKQLSVDKKSELVARSKKIINAEQLAELHGVIDMLHEHQNEGSKYQLSTKAYFILIDKLDEKWVDNAIRFRLIRALIESLRAFRKISNLKIVIALRADVIERVVQESQDLSFQREKYDDYIVKMKWTKDLLLEVVRKRVRTLFRKKYSPQSTIEFGDVFTFNVGAIPAFDYIVERTLMRPRDVIAFVNQCIIASEGTYEVTGSHIRQAEKEYSRVRREALEQEWQSAFPTLRKLLDFVSYLRKDSFALDELTKDDRADTLALELGSTDRIAFDPAYVAASEFLNAPEHKDHFVKEILSILYRVGAIGIKLRATDRVSYSHVDEPVVASASIPDNARVRIHPMLHAALRIGADHAR